MNIFRSKLTAQGQVSLPDDVQRQLGVGPGSVLVWEWRDSEVVVRRARNYTSVDIHEALFGALETRKKPVEVKAGVRKHIRRSHFRD